MTALARVNGSPNSITLVLPYYINGGMLKEHARIWRSYPADLRQYLHVIVVDDGSPSEPALAFFEAVEGIGSLRLYRIGVDVRWNWLACRNLGVDQASTKWVLLTDMDHAMPVETFESLLVSDLNEDHVYRLSRVTAPEMTPYKPHPNTWFMRKKMFDKIGGYDERFSGYYGTDGEFRDRVQSTARGIVLRPEVLIRYPREVIADASTTTYLRKQPIDNTQVHNIRRLRGDRPPIRLTFPWTRLV